MKLLNTIKLLRSQDLDGLTLKLTTVPYILYLSKLAIAIGRELGKAKWGS